MKEIKVLRCTQSGVKVIKAYLIKIDGDSAKVSFNKEGLFAVSIWASWIVG
nr:MAG TPA: hypothetical protein [Bacteriophage sp.]